MAVGGILSDCPSEECFLLSEEVLVVVAGKPGSGKSTALTNIFGVQLKAGVASASVTKKITTRNGEKNGVRLTVVDTPGLGALNIDKELVVQEVAGIISGRSFMLLYCLSVAPSCRFTELDETIVTDLQSMFTEKVWDSCVVLLTFSDTARQDGFERQEAGYKEYIKKVAAEFHSILVKCGSDCDRVKTVFDFEHGTILHRSTEDKEIVAIPVGKTSHGMEHLILPGVFDSRHSWTDLAFLELMRKTDEHKRRSFVALKYGIEVTDPQASSVLVGLGSPSSPVIEAVEESRQNGGGRAETVVPAARRYTLEYVLSFMQRHLQDCCGSSSQSDLVHN